MRPAAAFTALASLAALSACVAPSAGPRFSEETVAHVPEYSIHFDREQPNSTRVVLHMPREAGPHTLFARATSLQLEPQVYDVRCDGDLVEKVGAEWVLPARCLTASWRVAFDRPEAGSVRPSSQRSVIMPAGWALLSGPTSILRLNGFDGQSAMMTIMSDKGPVADTLPPLDKAPGFFILGNAPSMEQGRPGLRLTYVADDPEAVRALVDPGLHLRAIDYMRDAIGRAQSADLPSLTVVWFGATRQRAEVSGAAGFDTLLANYVLSDGSPSPMEEAVPFVLVLHEQFHQLAIAATPHWISESLANYYALKAAGRILPDDPGVRAARDMFIDCDAPAPVGLLELQRRIDEDGDFSGYMQFYSIGATFWARLDEALAAATDGARDLDDVLPIILAADYSQGAGLPPDVLEALSPIPAGDLASIFEIYL